MKQKLNYLTEIQWVLFDKPKIRPLNEKLKFSIGINSNTKYNGIFNNKIIKMGVKNKHFGVHKDAF